MNDQIFAFNVQPTPSKETATGAVESTGFVRTTPPAQTFKYLAKREWSTNLFDCCNEWSECFLAHCFPTCYQCLVFARADESFDSCLFGGVVPLRTKIRMQRGIRGSICEDCCCLFWCYCCTIIQMNKELKLTEPLI